MQNTVFVEDAEELEDPTFALEDIGPGASDGGALRRLATGMAGAVRWRGAMAPGAAEAVGELAPEDFEAYDRRRLDPPILKVGPAVYDFYVRDQVDESYFDAAQAATGQLRRIFGVDPVTPLLERLSHDTGVPVRPASIGGRPLHVGILREFPVGSKTHYDEVVREYPGRLDVEPVVQLAFNLHLVTPREGGELTVWKHRWVPYDDRARDGYGWQDVVVRHVPSTTVPVGLGDGVFFDCRNFHRVADFSGGRRITLSFFCGFTVGNGIIVWS